MDNMKPEEKSPLLLYMVEGEENNCKNNKRVNFEKGRLYGISSGATAVFTEFPNYVSPCWITTVLSSLMFFMMVLLMVSSMESAKRLRIPRCIHSHSRDLENKTIFLVHDMANWFDDQLNILEKINIEYQGYHVYLTLLRPEPDKTNLLNKITSVSSDQRNNSELTTKKNVITSANVNEAVIEIKTSKRSKRAVRRKKREPMGFGMGVKGLLDILLHSRLDSSGNLRRNTTEKTLNLTELFPTLITTEHPRPKSLEYVIRNFPGMNIRNVTYEEAFSKTPLEKSWFKFNHDLAIFALRIVQLWQNAGLSFKIHGIGVDKNWDDIDNFSIAPDLSLRPYNQIPIQLQSSSRKNKLLNFINAGKIVYDTLPKDVVTADDEGLHIITKMPCHVFFGEVLLHLKLAKGDETPKMIIQKSLRVFCKHSAVGQNYCKNIITNKV